MRRQIVIFGLGLAILSGCASSDQARSDKSPTANGPTLKSAADLRSVYSGLHLFARSEMPGYVAMLCRGPWFGDFSPVGTAGPHKATAVKILMNDGAAKAFREHEKKFPVGAVIVKEKHPSISIFELMSAMETNPDPPKPPTTGIGVGGMIKRAPGYDPAHGDWEFFYSEDPARKIESGRLENCRNCHDAAALKDHVYGDWAKGAPRS